MFNAAALIIVLAVALVAAGCDFRDEPVRPAAGATTVWPHVPPRDANAVEYVEGYDAAVRRAAGEGRPLLLVFGARWCRWSGELTGGPLADRTVVARTRRFVCGLVDADRDAATCRAYGVTAFPTVVVIDSAGAERFRAAGPDIATGLAAALDGMPDHTPPRRLAEEGSPNGPPRDVTR
ncbi:MAG: thioredoxin family protein [Planctomycetaceae bacterium]